MKQKLPMYIVESLLASGFDDIVSIVGMNLDDRPVILGGKCRWESEISDLSNMTN